MDKKKVVVASVILIVLFGLVVYAEYRVAMAVPGAVLEGTVTIQYEDGTKAVLSGNDQQLFSLLQQQLNVLMYNNKKLTSISTNVNLRFTVTPSDKTLKCQYWVLYWIEVDGTFFWGARLYSSLTGFVDTPSGAKNTYYATKAMNKWAYKVGNPSLGWGTISSFVSPFYAEATSSVWVDLSTYITDPQTVTNALSGVPIVGSLADKLGAMITSAQVKNGDNPLLISWTMTGPDFYTRLKRSDFNGIAVHFGDFTIGTGEFARMNAGDQYTVKFNVGYFFRYQDVTGEWTSWKVGQSTLASLNMQVAEGTWYVLSADISGGITVGA